MATREIEPAKGPQENFYSCAADGALYGGSAGCGKTVLLQLLSAFYYDVPDYTGVVFRRVSTSIMDSGGMWDSGVPIYHAFKGRAVKSRRTVYFPDGGKLKYGHLKDEDTKIRHQGLQYAFIGFDELTEFTQTQWAYLITRNRPAANSNLLPFWRATCNPDAESWVRNLIDWWIDPETGYAIPERCGVLRYYTVEEDQIRWVDKNWKDFLGVGPKSFTYFAAKLDDNPAPNEWKDDYRRTLSAQDEVTRERLLNGNWNITYKGGMFNPTWFKIEDHSAWPAGIKNTRYYDMAKTKQEENETKQPASTASMMGGLYGGDLWLLDCTDWMETPGKVEEKMRHTAELDGFDVSIAWEEEKGSAGGYVSNHLHTTVFKGYECHPDPVSGDKLSRAKPVAAMAEQGRIHLLRAPWNRPFLAQAGVFYSPGRKCDMVDALSGLHKVATKSNKIWTHYSATRHCTSINLKWSEMEQHNIVIVINLVGDRKNGIYGLCSLWGRKSKKLYVYAEIVQPSVVIDDLVRDVRKKAVVALEKSPSKLYADKMFVSESLDAGGDDVRKLLRKAGLRFQVNQRADDTGGAIKVNSMFNCDEIVVDSSCTEADRQFKEWTYKEKAGGRPMEGFPLCKALCGVVTELRAAKELDDPKPPKPYSYQTQAIREKLRAGPEKVSLIQDRGMLP